MTKEDKKKSIKEIKSMNSSDESDIDSEEDEQPKKILNKVLGDTTKIITNNNNITKTFTCNEADILVIKDNNGDYWYKGKDLAILLEYSNTNAAIINNVKNKKYKKSYAELGVSSNDPSLKIDPQTIFVDDTGLFLMVSRSKKEILPILFRTGTYTLPIKDSDVEKLKQNFYDDNMLSSYMGSPCIYFAYIGKHKITLNGITKEEHVIKYEKTIHMEERDPKQHRKFYKTFNVIKIWKTLAYDKVEDKIEANFQSLNILVDLKIKGIKKEKKRAHYFNRKTWIRLLYKHN